MEKEFEGWKQRRHWGLIKKKRSIRPRVNVKTSVRVFVYMVEEKGIKIENKNTKNIRLR